MIVKNKFKSLKTSYAHVSLAVLDRCSDNATAIRDELFHSDTSMCYILFGSWYRIFMKLKRFLRTLYVKRL